MKDEIITLFMELLDEWEIAEDTAINYMGDISDYEELRERKKDYITRINKLLNKL